MTDRGHLSRRLPVSGFDSARYLSTRPDDPEEVVVPRGPGPFRWYRAAMIFFLDS